MITKPKKPALITGILTVLLIWATVMVNHSLNAPMLTAISAALAMLFLAWTAIIISRAAKPFKNQGA